MKQSTIIWNPTSMLPVPNTFIMIAYTHKGAKHVNPFFKYTGKFSDDVDYWAFIPTYP